MTRPKKNREVCHFNYISVRLTDMELENVNATAEASGLSRSEYIRRALLNTKVSVKYEIVPDMDDIKKLTAEFGKIGSNLNQIARYFNTGGGRSLAMEDEIHQCISELFKLRKEVLRLAGDYGGSAETHQES